LTLARESCLGPRRFVVGGLVFLNLSLSLLMSHDRSAIDPALYQTVMQQRLEERNQIVVMTGVLGHAINSG
jgi:hypothetical protein